MDRLPKGWSEVEIGVLINKGKTINPKLTPNKEFTYIDISSIDNNQFKIIEPKSILGQDAPSRARKMVKINDIVFATTRPNLKNIAVVIEDYSNPVASTGFCILSPNQDLVESKYLFYFLTTQNIQDQITPFIRGSQYPAISDSDLLNCLIAQPPLPEQKRIVSKLDALFERIDKSIALLEENIKQTEHLMASALDKLFRDLIQTNNQVELNDVCVFKNGYAFKSKEFNEVGSGIQVLRIGNVLNKAKNPVYIEENPNYEKALLQKDDIIISLTGTRTKQDYLFVSLIDEKKYYLNQRVGAIRTKENMFFKFLYFFLQTSIFRQDIFQFETGTVNQGNISGKDILRMQIPLPSLDKQMVLSEKMEKLTMKVSNLNEEHVTKLTNLKALKASVLDKAFKGEL